MLVSSLSGLKTVKIIVYEYVSGGGYGEKLIPPSILSEGFSMLRTIIADLKAAGHTISTVLDVRLAALKPPLKADSIATVSSFKEAEITLKALSESADAAYIIAPESNNILQSLVVAIEHTSVKSLNSESTAIKNVSSKATMLSQVKEAGLPTPNTRLLSTHISAEKIKQEICNNLEFPLIVKPLDGAGCAGISVVTNTQQITNAVTKVINESSENYFIVQELISGVAASVSLLSNGSYALPLSLNKQDVTLTEPNANSTYNGGQVPFDNPCKNKAFATAQKAVQSFHGLKGYIGVDMIITENEAYIIEINPRLTVSYLGLRKTVNLNVAEAIINTALEKNYPQHLQNNGYAVFSKVNTPKPTFTSLEKTYSMTSIVAPPFPISDSNVAYAMLLAHGSTLKDATKELHKAKSNFSNLIR
ncbi:MAG: ATP-grasp domain-containing protein [Candidatus Bathyarchaeia archaeon]